MDTSWQMEAVFNTFLIVDESTMKAPEDRITCTSMCLSGLPGQWGLHIVDSHNQSASLFSVHKIWILYNFVLKPLRSPNCRSDEDSMQNHQAGIPGILGAETGQVATPRALQNRSLIML